MYFLPKPTTTMKYFILLATTCAMLSCAPRPTSTAADSDTDMEMNDPMAGQGTDSELLQSTMNAIETNDGNITALPPSAAVSNIDSWINELRGMDGTESIVGNLTTLKGELNEPSIDGQKVSQLLSTLANETRALAGNNQGVSTLATYLDAGATTLGMK